jgi:Zn-dependent peptidase ImmA (M78 family)
MPHKPSSDPRGSARQLLADLKIKAAPIQVEKVAKGLGAVVRYSPLDTELSGMIFIKDGIPVIGVNALHHPNRQRFTIAHEIGHLVMHKSLITANVHVDKQFPILMRDAVAATGLEAIEVEANQFASELLIPSNLFDLSKIRSFDIDDVAALDELAKKFRVSRQMLEYRIRSSNSP